MSDTLLIIIYGQIIFSYATAIFHLFLYINVFDSLSLFWLYPIYHFGIVLLYGLCIMVYAANKIKVSHFRVYVNHVSPNSIDDYFFTFGFVIIAHLFFAGLGLFIWLDSLQSYFINYGLGGILFGIIIPINVRKPMYKKKKEDSDKDEESEEEEEEEPVNTNESIKPKTLTKRSK